MRPNFQYSSHTCLAYLHNADGVTNIVLVGLLKRRGRLSVSNMSALTVVIHSHGKNQPLVKDTPALSILLSAAILFSGSTPGKAFLVLKFLMWPVPKNDVFMTNRRNNCSLPYVGAEC